MAVSQLAAVACYRRLLWWAPRGREHSSALLNAGMGGFATWQGFSTKNELRKLARKYCREPLDNRERKRYNEQEGRWKAKNDQ